MDTTASLLRFAKRFFAGTLLSRISGALRDIAMAFCFGSAPEVGAFMVAYRFANLFRRLFGEGNLQAGFIPQYETIHGENPKKALLFYRDTSFSLLFLLLGLIAFLEAVLLFLHLWIPGDWKEVIELTMWMMPGLLFICLYALNSAFLQAQKSYFSPAVAPLLFNVGWIFAAFYAHLFPLPTAMRVLSFGVVLSFLLQWMLTSFKVRQKFSKEISLKEWFAPNLFSDEWKKLIKPLLLGVIGIGAMQINGVIDAVFARLADLSGPAYLWFAIRIQQLPLALFGIALSGALLPPLARAMRDGANERYRTLLHGALRHASLLMVPSTFALFALGRVGVNLLFGRGDFSPQDVEETTLCLFGYGLALLPSVLSLLLSSGLYAKKKYGAPALSSLVAVGVNGALNAFFVFGLGLGAVSIALATSLASCVNAGILAVSLRRKMGPIFPDGFGRLLLELGLTGVVAWGCSYGAMFGLGWQDLPRTLSLQLAHFGVAGIAFGVPFLGLLAWKRKVRPEKIEA